MRKNNINTIEYCIPYTIDGVKAFFLFLYFFVVGWIDPPQVEKPSILRPKLK